MGLFGTGFCEGCGEKVLKSRLAPYEGREGTKKLCPGCREIQSLRDKRIVDHLADWERVRCNGGGILIEGVATVDDTWLELAPDMIAIDSLRTMLEEMPITESREAQLSRRPFALESVRRPLRLSDLLDRDPDFLAQILEAYSLDDLMGEVANVLWSFLHERVTTIPFIGDVELVKKVFFFDRKKGRVDAGAHYALAAWSKVSTAAGGIQRPIKRMVVFRAGENRYLWTKFVDQED